MIPDGQFVDNNGLYVPRSYANHQSHIMQNNWFTDSPLDGKGFNFGHDIYRDENTLVARFPKKGSSLDDWASAQIVDGNIANVGVSPVIHPQITSMCAIICPKRKQPP